MIKNYFKTAWRTLQRKKLFSFINIFGLATGLTFFGIICIYIYDEITIDRDRPGNLYRVITTYKTQQNDDEGLSTVGRALVQTISEEVPEVKSVIPVRSANFTISKNNNYFFDNILYTGSDFLNAFNYPMISGNAATALKDPYSIVLTKKMAEKYFGKTDIIGKILQLNDTIPCTITGVVPDPASSHVQFDMLLSFATFTARQGDMSMWFTWDTYCYVQLHKNADPIVAEQKIASLSMKHNSEQYKAVGYNVSHELERAKNINLHSAYGGIHTSTGKMDKLWITGIIGLVLLMLAIINFINLSTAQQSERMKEVGIRKTIGASAGSLQKQFIVETFLTVFCAGLFASLLIPFLLPYADVVIEKELSPSLLLNPVFFAAAILLLFLVTMFAAWYPAFMLSRFKPVQSLRATGTINTGSGFSIRKVLVVFQFAVSIIIIIGTIIATRQINFMAAQPLGFSTEQMVVVPLRKLSRQDFVDNYNSIRNQLMQLPGVTGVTGAAAMPGRTGWGSQVVIPEGFTKDNSLTMEVIPSDHHYVSTLGITMKSGRDFSTSFATDIGEAVLLNETACKMIGWTASEALGKTISTAGMNEGRVIGVMKDYHQHGLQNKIGPVLTFITPAYAYNFIALRTAGKNLSQAIGAVENFWNTRFPGYPFEYFMLDDDFNLQYQAEQRFAKITSLFSILTIVIACLGLFGLAMHATSQRIKEIGIRKLLGASVASITMMLSFDFFKLVIISAIIAFPAGWYIMNNWLTDFAYRVTIGWGTFAIAGLIALFIAFLTVSYQAIKSALANPVKGLRTE